MISFICKSGRNLLRATKRGGVSMDLALLLIAAKAFLKKGTARELKIGESCPQDNTFLPAGTACINRRVQLILPKE